MISQTNFRECNKSFSKAFLKQWSAGDELVVCLCYAYQRQFENFYAMTVENVACSSVSQLFEKLNVNDEIKWQMTLKATQGKRRLDK